MIELFDFDGGETVNHRGLFETTALERYGYERATLSLEGRLQFIDDLEKRVEAHPEIHEWRLRLHRSVVEKMPAGEKRERLLRSPPVDNKETFLIEWRGKSWYVQFWDGWVTMSRRATVRREW